MNHENQWRVFALSGDPFAYLEYARYRNEERAVKRPNENNKSKRVGS